MVAYETLTEKYLKRFGGFLQTYFDQLYGTGNQGKHGRPSPEFSPINTYPLNNYIWNFMKHPIELSWAPESSSVGFEDLLSINIPPEGNMDAQKVLLVLVNLSSQMTNQKNRALDTYADKLLLYGDSFDGIGSTPEASSTSEGEGHIVLAKFLTILCEFQCFLQECSILATHCVQQLAALFKNAEPHVVSINNLSIPAVFASLGDMLASVIVLEEIVRCQTILKKHWKKYKQMIKSVRADSSLFGTEAETLVELEDQLRSLENDVISGQLFRNLLDKVVKEVGKPSFTKKSCLMEKMLNHIAHATSMVEVSFNEGEDYLQPVNIAALFIFSATLFPKAADQKKFFFKSVWPYLKKIPSVAFPGAINWIPEMYLNSYNLISQKFFDARALQACELARQQYLNQLMNTIDKDVSNYHFLVAKWSTEIQDEFYSKDMCQIGLKDVSRRCELLIRGVKFAQQLRHKFYMTINLHETLGRPITKHLLATLCQILELLKFIQLTFYRFNVQVSTSAVYIVQNVIYKAIGVVKEIEKSLKSSDGRKNDELKSDSVTVLKILENALKGEPSTERRLVCKMALDWAVAYSKVWKVEQAPIMLAHALEKISIITDLMPQISRLCNCSCLYWYPVIFPAYFQSIYETEIEATKLPLVCLMINDCYRLLDSSPHKEAVQSSFVNDIERYLKNQMTDKLCRDVETDVRLLSHSHLQAQAGEVFSPFRNGIKDFHYLLSQPFLSIAGKKLSLKHLVSKPFLASIYLYII